MAPSCSNRWAGDFAAKISGDQEGHGALPGFNLPLSTATLLPAILFADPASGLAGDAPRRAWHPLSDGRGWVLGAHRRGRAHQAAELCVPAYPALVILAALWPLAPKQEEGWRRWSGLYFGIAVPDRACGPDRRPRECCPGFMATAPRFSARIGCRLAATGTAGICGTGGADRLADGAPADGDGPGAGGGRAHDSAADGWVGPGAQPALG